MTEGDQQTVERLLTKSKEAFTLAVELYNRPTLKYHAESCSIFLCNAWELMLKAHLVKTHGIESIYYKDNPDRTLSLEDCLKKVYTNEKSPLRVNMRELISFRNVNTHFITDEYELFYGPFLQAAVNNYADKLLDLHDESVSDLMPENHLTLAVRRGSIRPDVIRAKYDPQVAEELLLRKQAAAQAIGEEGNSAVAAIFETTFRLVKKENEADLNVFVDSTAESGVAIVRDVKDSSSFYPFTAKGCIDAVNKRLKKKKVVILRAGEVQAGFNQYHFQLFVKGHNLKGNSSFSYDRRASNEKDSKWVYAEETVTFIATRLIEEPDTYLDKLQAKVAKSKK